MKAQFDLDLQEICVLLFFLQRTAQVNGKNSHVVSGYIDLLLVKARMCAPLSNPSGNSAKVKNAIS